MFNVNAKSFQSCPTLCSPADCSPPWFSVHVILQARMLEWVAMLSSRESFQHRNRNSISYGSWFAGKFFTTELPGKPKNVQTTEQLCSFLMLVRLCSKSFKLGFSNTWTKNFQMYKLSLEKAEESEIKLPTFIES